MNVWKDLPDRALFRAMSDSEPLDAAELVRRHGGSAHQVVIDEIVRAISRNDDNAAAAWDARLQAVVLELERINQPPVLSAPYRVR